MGASLWLIPPPGSALQKKLQSLISTTLPKHISDVVPDFQPHVTITSSIPESLFPTAQSVLDSLPLPSPAPTVAFKRVRYGTAFFTKITLELYKNQSLKDLAIVCRSELVPEVDFDKAKEWSERYTTPAESGEEGFIPHLSLVYWDGDAKGDSEAAVELRKAVEQDVNEAGVKCGAKEEGSIDEAKVGEMEGWAGGVLIIVDCQGKVEDWKVLAERKL